MTVLYSHPIAQTRLQKTVDNFFTRTKRLYNYLIYACPSFYQKPDKTTLTDIYHTFFQKKYNETNACKWRLLCRCGNCNPLCKTVTKLKLGLSKGDTSWGYALKSILLLIVVINLLNSFRL